MTKKDTIELNPKNEGTFTASARRAGKSVQAFATEVIKKYKGKKGLTETQKTLLKRAVFAKNAAKWNK